MLTVEEQIRLIADAAMDALDLDNAAERRATARETVLDHKPAPDTWSPVQFTEEVVTMIDVKTTDPTEPRQKRPMRVVAAGILAAAAAVVAIVFVASSDVDVVTPADEPVPLPPWSRALLEPGTYFVDEVTGKPTARILFTIGAGWHTQRGPGIGQFDIGQILFSRPYAVFSDACHAGPAADDSGIDWNGGMPPDPGPEGATVDSLVAALSEQRGWADVTTPSDISVDGYVGKAFQRTVPADISDCERNLYGPRTRPANFFTKSPRFRSWEGYEWGLFELYEPGEVETLWVLDIDGTVVVIHTRLLPSVTAGARALAGPSAAARAEFAAVLDSIRIERG
jgi:hypothetical protein